MEGRGGRPDVPREGAPRLGALPSLCRGRHALADVRGFEARVSADRSDLGPLRERTEAALAEVRYLRAVARAHGAPHRRASIGAARRARRADRPRAESSVSPTSREVATVRLRAEKTLKDGLAARIRPGAALLLDSSTLIEYLYQGSPVGVVAASIVDDLVATGRNRAFVSAISATEILVRPFEQPRTEIATEIVGFLEHFPNLTVLSLDLATAIVAAGLRADHRLSSVDALIVATGLTAGVAGLVTNDADWKKRLAPITDRVEVLYLGAMTPS
ncbi:MAG: type II toxin-antitoxin system VapC family toxin [Chloroflexi bacterium]|nr:MAG: type II toxin-antitoxin system VapC family toxin [Chloroflexota bacterium]